MRGILLFLGLTLCSAAVGADRQPDFYCRQVSIESGLSQSSVTSLLRDRRGLLWIGTRSGLNLFDRDDLTNYFHDRDDARSIPGNYIYHLSEDCRGRIWVATDGGLAVYDRSTDGFRTVTEELVFSSAVVGERIYFGGKKVLYRYDCTTDEMENIYFTGIEPYNVSPDYHITGIERLGPHSLLLATPGKGVFRYDDRSRKVGPFLELPSTATLTSLYVSADGTVWLSLFKRGLFHYDASGRFLRRYGSADSGLSNDIILDLAEYNGRLWLATDGGGINILNLATSEVRILRHIPGDAGSLPVNSITVLYNDSGNNLWAGTVRGGLLGIKTTHMRVFPDATLGSHYGLSERSVISLYEDADGIVWVGTDGGGLNRYDPATNNFTHYESTYGDKITSITELSPGRLLLSAYSKGLSLFDTSSGRTTPFVIENAMTNLREIGSGFQQLAHRVSDDKIYILSQRAIVYDIPHGRFRYMGYDSETVDPGAMFLVYSDAERSYAVKKNRIYEIRQADDSIRLMHTLDAHETISALCHDGGDRIWIGTNHGLFRYDRGADSVFAVKTNLFDEISAMQLDSRGRLWIGAHNMLFSYDTREERFSIWGEADGFSSNELLYTYQSTPRHGNVYLGGTGGLVRIREDISFEEESVPTVSLGEALLDGRICLPDPAGRIRIPWNYRTLTVKVALNEEDVFHRPLLRYEIHGKSTRRIETFDHRLDLSMLSPGDWQVDVSCSTRSGGWTTPAPLLSVFVRQAWYKTPLFFGLTLLFLMSAVLYAAYRVFRRRERHLQWELKLREQSVNEEKIRFLINISHELRTPLSLIYAPLKRLLSRPDVSASSELAGPLRSMLKQAGQMKEIINMVLDLDNPVAEQERVKLGWYDFNEWAGQVVGDFRSEFANKGLSLDFRPAPELGPVCFDVAKCKIVLSNFLMNALKFSAGVGKRVQISTLRDGDRVRVLVADEGLGLGDVDIDRLFTRFYRAHRDIKGSGIGLSYSKFLIEKQGGHIGAFDNGSGATFWFDIPADGLRTAGSPGRSPDGCDSAGNPALPDVPADPLRTPSEAPEPMPCSVLVVEDNADLNAFLTALLREYFDTVHSAFDGVQALDVLHAQRIDLVVSDVMMPRMDGYELCRSVKNDLSISHVPVVLLTARSDAESILTGYKMGADGYLSKPFDNEVLVRLVSNIVSGRRRVLAQVRQSATPPHPDEISISPADERFLTKLNGLIETSLGDPALNVAYLTDRMAMSRATLYSKMKQLTGMGVNDYVNRKRIERAIDLLVHTDAAIGEISDRLGFEYPRYFSTLFKQVTGQSPTDYRDSHRTTDTPPA